MGRRRRCAAAIRARLEASCRGSCGGKRCERSSRGWRVKVCAWPHSSLSLLFSPSLFSVFGGRYFLESSVSLLLPRSVFRSRKVYSTWSKACAYRFSHRRVERTTTVRQYAGLVDTEYRKQMEICKQINHARGGSHHLGKNGDTFILSAAVVHMHRRRLLLCAVRVCQHLPACPADQEKDWRHSGNTSVAGEHE